MPASQEARLELQTRVNDRIQERLAHSLNNLFDELDVRLFDLTERHRVAAQQQLYFDAMRQMRFGRVDVETSFLRAAMLVFQPASVHGSPQSVSPRGPLQLLDKGEQEETLYLESQIQRLADRLAPALRNLTARLCELADMPPPDDPETSAVSATSLSRAFRKALGNTDVNMEIRLIAAGLFGQHVLDSLDALYADLNEILIEAGVLPDLPTPEQQKVKRPVPRIRRNAPRKLAETDAAENPPEPPEPGTLPDGHMEQLDELQHLMHARKMASQAVTAPASGNDGQFPVLETRILDKALDELWTYEGKPLQFKEHLIASARELAQQENAVLEADDEDIVDLVGLLFSQIVADPELPEPLQGMLARLHIPFLRTALEDPGLLRGASHPGRELIDELGDIAISWCSSADSNSELLKLIALTVEQLASHFKADQPIQFSQALKDLRKKLETSQHRADLSEQRAIEAAIGRERLNLARTRVVTLMERRFARHEPMSWVRQLLRGPWSHHLVLVWLRFGENSPEYRQVEAFVDELLWVDEATPDEDTYHERLREARQQLPAQLRDGLASVTLHDSDIEGLVSRLEAFIDAQIHSADMPDFLFESDPTLARADFARQWDDLTMEEQPDSSEIDPDMLAKLRSLPPGTWFEFRKNGEDAQRAKLCWTSPYTGYNLFVNRNGQKISEVPLAALATLMESGLARLIDSNRLLERSLQTLVDQLRANIGESQPCSEQV